ncbi:hypothetical protein GALMADRAFT_235161 [Galerina marginata CBS 339.88]|uniref:Nephrocystin 3-like N-terminal domain-containing protein n=1 Tax=Galerina marginata (strain CBS 339.88) TaxID=685588 RepID=A0A067TUI3_GALM3|nr:hypothetical protein GALMADRAFT_235161 [Galerina marginata CBS 339.88]
MFSGENILVTGGTFTTVVEAQVALEQERREKAIERLRKNVAQGAFHNAAERYDPPRCHTGTREAIMKEVMDWINSLNDEYFLWLYGPAGAGKSAIAQTIAELCSKLGLLAASFFFSRTVPGRNNDKLLVPTMAYQLTISIPGICNQIADAIVKDPLIFDRTLEIQFNSLIVETLAKLPLRDSFRADSHPKLIVIDGLDECSEPNTQHYILSTLSSAALRDKPLQLTFLIASRPEHDIRNGFDEDGMNLLTRRLVLDDKYLPYDDILYFLKSKFDEIKERHPLKSFIPPSWPSMNDLEYLVTKSSSQFIYASTVMKFVESRRHRPTDRLDIVLGLKIPGNNTPFAQLDALYACLFEAIEDLEPVMKVLSFFVTRSRYQRRDPPFVEEFLHYQPGDLQIILADLHSIMHIPSLGASGVLHVFHESLGDFLTDKSRSRTLYIDISIAHATMAEHSVTYLSKSPGDYEPFLEHLLNAYPTDELLSALSEANLEKTFDFIIQGLTVLLFRELGLPTRLVTFLKLLQGEFTADKSGLLHRAFQSHFDGYVRSKLSHYTLDPDFFHLATAFTLDCIPRWHAFYIFSESKGSSLLDDPLGFHYVDGSNLRFYDSSPGYRSAMVTFFTDINRSGVYYIGRRRYIDLATECVQYLCRSRGLGWGWRSKFEPQFKSYASSAILEIISRFPREHRLVHLFLEIPFRNIVEDEEFALKIEAYSPIITRVDWVLLLPKAIFQRTRRVRKGVNFRLQLN